MSAMIERVARALYAENNPTGKSQTAWELYRFDARAAIAAMRAPTNDMINAAYDANQIIPEECWPVMIDAALTSKTCGGAEK